MSNGSDVQLGIVVVTRGADTAKVAINGITQGLNNTSKAVKEARFAVANLSDGWKKLLDQGSRQFEGIQWAKKLSEATHGAVLPAGKLAEKWAKLHEIGAKRLQAIDWANQLAAASTKAETSVEKLSRQWSALSAIGAKRLQAIDWANQLTTASAKAETSVEKLARQWGALSDIGAKRLAGVEWANKLSTASVSRQTTTTEPVTPTAGTEKESNNLLSYAASAIKVAVAGKIVAETFAAVRKALAIGDSYANLQARIKLVSGTMQEQVVAMQSVYKIAQDTRSPLKEVAQLYYRLAVAASTNGMNQQDTLRITDLVAKSLKISGASATESAGALQQFSQAMQAGVLNGDEFRSVMENMPRLAKALTDSLKVNIGALREMSAQGQLTFGVVSKALQEQASAIDTDFSKMPLTVEQAMVRVANASEMAIGRLSQIIPVGNALKVVLNDIAKGVESVSNWMVKAFPKSVEDRLASYEARMQELLKSRSELEASVAKYGQTTQAPVTLLTDPSLERLKAAANTPIDKMWDANALVKVNEEIDQLANRIAGVKKQVASNSADQSFFTNITRDAVKATVAAKGFNEEQQKNALKVFDEANRQGVSAALALSIAEAESGFNSMAKSAKGALGIMQLMPDTAKALGVNINDDNDNIKGGIALLKDLQAHLKSNTLAVAGYNAGEPAIHKFGNAIPPMKETRDYVEKITGLFGGYSKAIGVNNAQMETATQKADRLSAEYRLLSSAQQEEIAKAEASASVAEAANRVKIEGIQNEIKTIQDKAKVDMDAAKSKDAQDVIALNMQEQVKVKLNEALAIARDQISIQESLLQKRLAALQVELTHADTEAHISEIKQQRIALEAQLATKVSERALLELDNGQKVQEMDQASLERKQKEQEFIQKINDDLKFQKDLYDQLTIAKQNGATDSQLTLLKDQANATREIPQNVSSSQITITQETLKQTEEYKKKINDIAGSANKVVEQQLRLNEAWDQTVQRMSEFSSVWERILGTSSKGFNNISKSLATYTKQLNQIKRDQQDALEKSNSAAQDEQINSAAQYDNLTASLATVADVTDQMKNMFEVGSEGYKEMEALSKTAALASQAVSIAKAVEAVMNALAEGDPYTAIPRAMAVAAMAISFLANIGATLSGGGASAITGKDYAKYQQKQADKYAATLLGSTEVSNSILDALDEIAKNSTANLDYSKGMAENLQIVANALANTGTAVAQDFSINTSKLMIGSSSQSNLKSMIGSISALDIGGLDKTLGALASASETLSKLDPIGRALGSMIFGTTKITREIAGKGIEIFSQSLKNIVESGFIKGREYVDVLVTEKTSALFGIINKQSQHIETYYQKLSTPISRALAVTFAGIRDSLAKGADIIGIGGDSFAKQIDELKLKIGRIPLTDNGKANAKKITAAISAQADRWAAQLYPQYKAFQQVGEGMFQTYVRMTEALTRSAAELSQSGIKAASMSTLTESQRQSSDVEAELVRNSLMAATGLEDVNGVLKDLTGSGADLIQAFKDMLEIRSGMVAMGLDAVAVTADMVAAAGGLSNFKQSISDFITNFMTPKDAAVAKWTTLANQFTLLGLKMPRTNDEFKKLVLSVDRTTASGQKLFGALIALEGQFYDATQSVNASIDNVQQAYDRQKQLAKSLRDYVIGLSVSNPSLSPEAKYLAAKRLFEDTLTKAQSGNEEAQANLQTVSQSFLDASRQYNASGAAFATDLQLVTSGLDSVASSIDGQLSAAEKQISAIVTNTSAVQSLTDAINEYLGNVTTNNGTGTAINDIVATQNNDPNVHDIGTVNQNNADSNSSAAESLKVRNAAALSFQAELTDLVASLSAATAKEKVAIKKKINAKIAEIKASPFSLDVTQTGGTSTKSYMDNAYTVSLRAKGGFTPKGFAIVGEQGPELVKFDRPAQILNARDTSKALGGDPKMVELLDDIKREIKALVTTQSYANPQMIEKLGSVESRLGKIERNSKLLPA